MDNLAEHVAAELLKTDGLAAVWKLHMVASRVHRDGYPREAERLLRIADAAEELVQRDFAHAISRAGCRDGCPPRHRLGFV
jgi:hypothetical protein